MRPELEEIPIGHKRTILAFRYEADTFDAPWHFHPQHELTFIEESRGTKFVGDYVGPYEQGELVLLRSSLPHSWKNNSHVNTKAKSIVIQWNKGIYANVPELEDIFSMLQTASKGILFEQDEIQDILPMLKEVITLDKTALYLQLQTILLKLSKVGYTTLSEKSFMDDLPYELSGRIAKVHDFIDENYHRKISLKELATVVNMSEQSFSRFFSKTMGRPAFTFLNEYRINMASRMLLDTSWSVSEICYNCGYESLPFFHRQFYRFKKESPNRYRKTHKR